MATIRIHLIIGVLLLACAGPALADKSICAATSGKSISIKNARSARSPGGPLINVSADRELRVRLIASDTEQIDLDSVEVRYSIFDITGKIKEHVGDITLDMHVTGDILPVGTHKLQIRVSDTAGRLTKLQLTLRVTSPTANRRCTNSVVASANANRPSVRG